jgi:hypothetical protein
VVGWWGWVGMENSSFLNWLRTYVLYVSYWKWEALAIIGCGGAGGCWGLDIGNIHTVEQMCWLLAPVFCGILRVLGRHFYGVRAHNDLGASGWSNVESVDVGWEAEDNDAVRHRVSWLSQ